MSTKRHRKKKGGTRKNKNLGSSSLGSSSLIEFQKEISVVFLEMLLMVKLFHWKTTSYATHKATDDLYDKLNEKIDGFIEILLGKTGLRIDLMNKKSLRLMDLSSQDSLKKEVNAFKHYLVSLDNNEVMSKMSNTDLYNIRDEILGELNQFLYLLTFK